MDAIAGIFIGLWMAAALEQWRDEWPERRQRLIAKVLSPATILLSKDFLIGTGVALMVVVGLALSSQL